MTKNSITRVNEKKLAPLRMRNGRNKNLDDQIKKHSRTSPGAQELSLIKQKTRPRTDNQ